MQHGTHHNHTAQHLAASRDHNKHAGHDPNAFLAKFWVSLVLTIPILVYSELFEVATGWQVPEIIPSTYLSLGLGSIIFFYGGWVFLSSAYRELRVRLPGMMTLIALAITTAYTYSIYVMVRGVGETLFWELSTLITIMLLGHWIEMRAVAGTRGALKELAKLLPDTAELISGDAVSTVPLSQLKANDIVLVRPGSKIPSDGVVVEGVSELNESIITGESKPVHKEQDSEVIAGSVNGDGSLKVRVTHIGEGTFLAGVMRLVAEAQSSKSRLQMLSDRAALYLTIVAIIAGGITFVAWVVAADALQAMERLVAVLVIACPHALGLAIPLVASISTMMAARNGFLVKERLALELARLVDAVLFDKTGTLTQGSFGVDAIIPREGISEDELLAHAASVNSQSEHPLAQAMVAEAKRRGLTLAPVQEFMRIAGMGARARVGGQEVSIGNEALLERQSVAVPEAHRKRIEPLNREGKTIIHVAQGNQLLGSIALADVVRDESHEAIQLLKAAGIKTAMITGDSEDVARWVAGELGIDEFFARVLPHEKAEKVKLLQERGMTVAMVGDGVNDAPALMQADLGIAIGAGTNVAIESAGIILVRSDPRDIAKVIHLSRMTYSKMLQNLFWATAYNIVALPVAAGVLAFKGIVLDPAVAAVFMSTSTVIVAVNALLLRRKKL